MPSPTPLVPGRIGVDLPIYPGNLGWYRSLRVVPPDSPIVKGNTTAIGDLGLEIIFANRTKLGRDNIRSLGGEDIYIELSTDAVKILDNNRLIYSSWYHLYINSIYQLIIRPSKWEKPGQLPHIDDIILVMFTDLGYSKKSVVWKLGRTVASDSRSISSSYISKFFELTNNIPENVKNFLFFVTTSISYLLFRVYSTEQLMINATSTMAAARTERSVPK